MSIRIALLTSACALALAACGSDTGDTSDTATTAAPPATATDTAPSAPATTSPAASPPPATTPPTTATPAATAATSGNGKPAAVVTDCGTTIEGNDAMQYNVGSISVPASCTEFRITLKHTGKLPVAAMGHNVVVTRMADMQAVAADGMAAGLAANFVKPDDARVIAHTDLIGGGQTTSVSFPVSKIQGNGPYEFFCSFPGHSALMKGTIAVQ